MKNTTIPKTTSKKLADVVHYQPDAIVSNEIIRKKSGTVTCFAFDKDQVLSEHTAPYDAMVVIMEGKSEISIGGKKSVVTKGQFLIMPANVPHAVKALEKFKMLLVMIKS